ncbi:leucyl aminopeptidase [Desulfovibrio sp. OttesenSCG-928-M16]|nr:leucyl aminopeptidase [Desulfovibrio sp. OttesenSCG-928-M16]
MEIRFQNTASGAWSADCALAFVFEKEAPETLSPDLWEQAPWLDISPALRDVTGKKGEQSLLYAHPDNAIPRVLVFGLGKRSAFSLKLFRDALAGAVQVCLNRGFEHIGLPVGALERLAPAVGAPGRDLLVREAVVAAMLCLAPTKAMRLLEKIAPGANATGDDDDDAPLPEPRSFSLLFSENETPESARLAARTGEAEAFGVRYARLLGNAPANLLWPAALADEARTLAAGHGFTCTVLDDEAIRTKGMGALYAVGRGSLQKPRFIILEHCPKGRENDRPIVVAGKGITFDTGGISLKNPAKMHEMKSDMGGAAAVLGLFGAIGNLPDKNVVPRLIGLISAAENMPSGNATRPGDVVTALNGKTVEILNTDAEGRLALCDALAYAQQEWQPALLLDIATLTGACVIALGDYGAGLFTDDKALRDDILLAAEQSGDLVWPLPLWDDYDENLKSDVADMTNMGPREGGAINAALFLRRFVDKNVRWAHLDIAGPGYVVKSAPLLPVAGSTGAGVRLLCHLIERQTNKE